MSACSEVVNYYDQSTIPLPATHVYSSLMIFFFFLISPHKSSTPHGLLSKTFIFLVHSVLSSNISLSLSLSLYVEVRSPSDPLIPCLTEELWIPHTSPRDWFQHQWWAFINFLTLSSLVDLRKKKIFIAKNLSLPT